LNDALLDLGSEISPLIRSAIYSDLSIAYAQDETEADFETKARDCVELAHMTMPVLPELDPFYQCIRMGSSELDQFEGKTYLCLAEHASNGDYAKKAYNAFERSLSKDCMNRGYLGQTLIFKAEASIGLV
jgi:hypothetical protein